MLFRSVEATDLISSGNFELLGSRFDDLTDIGYSTPDDIAGEMKVAAASMLKRPRIQLEKIRKAKP